MLFWHERRPPWPPLHRGPDSTAGASHRPLLPTFEPVYFSFECNLLIPSPPPEPLPPLSAKQLYSVYTTMHFFLFYAFHPVLNRMGFMATSPASRHPPSSCSPPPPPAPLGIPPPPAAAAAAAAFRYCWYCI